MVTTYFKITKRCDFSELAVTALGRLARGRGVTQAEDELETKDRSEVLLMESHDGRGLNLVTKDGFQIFPFRGIRRVHTSN